MSTGGMRKAMSTGGKFRGGVHLLILVLGAVAVLSGLLLLLDNRLRRARDENPIISEPHGGVCEDPGTCIRYRIYIHIYLVLLVLAVAVLSGLLRFFHNRLRRARGPRRAVAVPYVVRVRP